MNSVHSKCSEITRFKSLPHLPGANESMSPCCRHQVWQQTCGACKWDPQPALSTLVAGNRNILEGMNDFSNFKMKNFIIFERHNVAQHPDSSKISSTKLTWRHACEFVGDYGLWLVLLMIIGNLKRFIAISHAGIFLIACKLSFSPWAFNYCYWSKARNFIARLKCIMNIRFEQYWFEGKYVKKIPA